MIKLILSFILVIFPTLSNPDDIGKGYQAYKSQDYLTAYQHWRITADDEDPISQCNIALLYFFGNGVEKNLKMAFDYCKKSAEQGHSYAQYDLGRYYEHGRGVTKNLNDSFYWYHCSAKQNNALAANGQYKKGNVPGVA